MISDVVTYSIVRMTTIACLLLSFGSSLSRADQSSANVRPQTQATAIGDRVGDLRFKDIRGLNRSLREFGTQNAFVLVFTTTHCPLVQKVFPTLNALHQQFGPQQVQFIAVNVGLDDSIRAMAAQAIDFDVKFPFVKDSTLGCARQLGVTRTPEVVVLDRDFRLMYRGRVDDQYRLGGSLPNPTRNELREAIQATLNGVAVSTAETPVDGCLISEPVPADPGQLAPEWHQDVAPIVARRCAGCHRSGSTAPFELLTYEDALANAEMLAEVVADQRMPPWFANSKHGKFQNDPSLTRKERDTLLNWVKSGRREGAAPPEQTPTAHHEPAASDAEQLPWRIGKPDLVISMIEEHQIPEAGYIPYRYSVLPYLFLNETWVESFEIRPDNPAVVHHCNMAYVTSDGAGEETFITGYVPGGQPMDLQRFDNGSAFRIPKHAGLGLQIHFTTTGKPERCRISVGIRYPRRVVQKQLRHFLLDPRGFRIPPHDPAFAISSRRTLQSYVDLMGLFAHMHVRGRDMTFYAHVPDRARETLLQIPNYNFEWQLGYEIQPGQKLLPAGTIIEAIAHFDNSAFNPYNPDPSKTVRYGPQTYDEMFNGFVFFVNQEEELNLNVDPATGRAR